MNNDYKISPQRLVSGALCLCICVVVLFLYSVFGLYALVALTIATKPIITIFSTPTKILIDDDSISVSTRNSDYKGRICSYAWKSGVLILEISGNLPRFTLTGYITQKKITSG